MDKNMELRMYGLVPYNMSPIQQGIQFGHAVVDYGQTVKSLPPFEKQYNDWANNWKTFIILNGGTTNTNPERLGTLNQHVQTLRDIGVMYQTFHEPDLGDQLTAVVFIVDERVFNKELYPDFVQDSMSWNHDEEYINWLAKIGGTKNELLREFLKQFKLA